MLNVRCSFHGKDQRACSIPLFLGIREDVRAQVLTCREDSGQPTRITQRMEYTDFTLDSIKFVRRERHTHAAERTMITLPVAYPGNSRARRAFGLSGRTIRFLGRRAEYHDAEAN
jgi:hypothetical protein